MQGKYEVPKHLTKEAKTLLSGMLTVDPKKRMGIPEIRKSEFLQKYSPKDTSNDEYTLTVDQEILKMCAGMNEIEPQVLDQQLQANRHNNATTHYYLLLQRKLKGLSIENA